MPAYFFLGGLAGGSSLLAAGADLTGRPVLRRSMRLTALVGVVGSLAALVHDLGRPARFHHMLRVAKVTSPMSVGTWLLAGYGPLAGVAALSEARSLLPGRLRTGTASQLLPVAGRTAGVLAGILGSAVASYTAVLVSDTATPSWRDAGDHLPFVFVGSAAASAGAMGMLAAPLVEAGPARRLAVGGAVLDLAATRRMESAMGLSVEPLHTGRAGAYLRAAKALTAGGGLLAGALGGRSRPAAAVAGAALLAGSVCSRFGVFHAGQQSAADPRYTVVPQRHRLDQAGPDRTGPDPDQGDPDRDDR